MRKLDREKLERSAAVGAVLVCLALAAFFVFFVWLSFPTGNGIDTTQAIVSWVSVGMLLLTVILAHLAYARILYRHSRGVGSA